MHIGRLVAVAALALFAAACTATGTGSIDAGTSIHADPLGDAGASPLFDIIEVRSVRTSTTLEFRVTTSTAIVLPAVGAFAGPTNLMFIAGFDTDLNTSTGIVMGAPCASGSQGLDFLIDGAFQSPRNVDGTYRVEVAAGGTSGATTGNATVAVNGPQMTLTIPLAALGGDDGRTNATILLGTGAGFADCAPDSGQMLPTRLGEPTAVK